MDSHPHSFGADEEPISDVPITVVFAGGGSGGHISPGLAIAERLTEISPMSKAIFVCSQRAIDAAMLSEAKARFVPIPASPPAIKPAAVLRFLMNFKQSRSVVKQLIREKNVERMVALGGFVAAPAVVAARTMSVPVMLVNLDAPPGRANQWIARRCDEVYSAIDLPMVPNFAAKVIGMPVRRRAIAPGNVQFCRERLNLDPRKKTLFVTGASQGATSINSFMEELVATHGDLFRNQGPESWQIYHLSGAGADEALRQTYSSLGVNATVASFLNDIGLAWGAADLALSRAGANSVAEAAINAVPTLFLPYPYHKDMHQRFNAQPLVDLGGAAMVDDCITPQANVEHVGPVLRDLLDDDLVRESMRDRLRGHHFPDAAMTIAKMLLRTHSAVP
jgi:UDP-N-acetylglucosamine--N-acetylmuramyl-(pentapeptide) pyrophosphoryl-undecaprenol N-acetylglucosamine transferase